jgi:hypothetical protein
VSETKHWAAVDADQRLHEPSITLGISRHDLRPSQSMQLVRWCGVFGGCARRPYQADDFRACLLRWCSQIRTTI